MGTGSRFKLEVVLTVIRLSVTPTLVGRIPGFLSSGKSLQEVWLSRGADWDTTLKDSCLSRKLLPQNVSLATEILLEHKIPW